MKDALVARIVYDLEGIVTAPPDAHRWFELSGAVGRWQGAGADLSAALDVAAAWIALKFHEGVLTYVEADTVINELSGAVQTGFHEVFATGWTSDALWVRIYLAFDAGEFRRPGEEDPVEVHTRPLIQQLLGDIAGLDLRFPQGGALPSISSPTGRRQATDT